MSKQYLGTFEQLVLLALASADGDADGMSIVDTIENASGREVSVPAVYVTLKRLEKKRLVTSEVRPDEGAGPSERKYFTLQPAGIDELAKARGVLESLWARARQGKLGGKA